MKPAVIALALILIPTFVEAQSTPPGPTKTLHYLTPEQISPGRLLAPPPADGSAAHQQEMATLRAIVSTRTPERYAQAVWDADHEDASLFSTVLGSDFDLQRLPALARLLEAVQNDQAIAASTAKDFFKRKFPVAVERPAAYRQWTCDHNDRQPESRPLRSYPSGHATLGYSLGGVLAALMPEKAAVILTRAQDYAFSREVCGDHYHSDVEASHALGSAVAALLLDNRALMPLVAAARTELRAAHLTR